MSESGVERFAVFEEAFGSRGTSGNPYRDVSATACFAHPDGGEWRIPLFYDGDGVWRVRISPDAVGDWRYRITADDPDLDGLAGAFSCLPSERRGGIVPMRAYPYHLAYQDGTPFWFFGDTQWRAFADNAEKRLDRTSVCRYIDVRAEQGFNYVHTDLMGGGGIDSGQRVFDSFAEERINPAFFREVDERIRYMNAKGITSGVTLAWHRGPVAWDAFPSDAARLRYARYVAARYSAFNVTFIVSGEWDQIHPERKALFSAIGRELQRCDPHDRMRAIHPGGRQSVAEFAGEAWMSFGDYQQLYRAPVQREATPAERRALHDGLLQARVHNKPVVNSEYAYYLREMAGNQDYHTDIEGVDKPHSHTRDSFRRASWVLPFAGGYFVTGFGTTYFGGWRDKGPFDVDAAKNDEAEADLLRLRAFFTALEWWRLEPASALVRAADGGFAYALADPGRVYAIYCEGTRGVTLDAASVRAGVPAPIEHQIQYQIVRYDPRTGESVTIDVQRDSGSIELAVPDTQDWAFVLTRVVLRHSH